MIDDTNATPHRNAKYGGELVKGIKLTGEILE